MHPNCAETANPGSRKLATGLPRAASDGPNFNCATLPSQIKYCCASGLFSPNVFSICCTSAGGVLSESNGPPGKACIVTKVMPVTKKKTGIDQNKRRIRSWNIATAFSTRQKVGG